MRDSATHAVIVGHGLSERPVGHINVDLNQRFRAVFSIIRVPRQPRNLARSGRHCQQIAAPGSKLLSCHVSLAFASACATERHTTLVPRYFAD
jgi:hypothetical protein